MKAVEALKRVPWIVWALLAPAVIMGGVKLWTGGTQPVPVVGAGVVSALRPQDAPKGVRYRLEVKAHEGFEDTAARAEEALQSWPDVVVFALDGAAIETRHDARAACETLSTLANQAHNATAVPVLASFARDEAVTGDAQAAFEAANRCWRERVCSKGQRRLCVDLVPHASSPRALRDAMRAAVLDAQARHEAWRASTQVGR